MRESLKAGAVVAPGVFNAASAMLAERAGFRAVYVSGAGLSNAQGMPDTGLLTLDEAATLSSYITRAVDVPVIIDADTGFGGPAEVERTAQAFIRIGASAMQIEDQEFPKRCGHLPGKSVVPAPEFIEKVRAAARVRDGGDKEFLIIARTDARAVEGMDGAVKRARAYLDAGADMIFPEALETKEEFAGFAEEVGGALVANMTEFGKTPYMTAGEFGGMGYSIVLFPMTCFRVAMKAMEDALAELKSSGTQRPMLDRMQTREELYRLLKYSPG